MRAHDGSTRRTSLVGSFWRLLTARVLSAVDRCRDAFHPDLQLQRPKLRVVPRLVQVAAMEPQGFLLGGLPHVAL